MTRRFFLRLGALAAGALAYGSDVMAMMQRRAPQPLTIAQLIAAAYPGVRQSQLDHEQRLAPELFELRRTEQLMTRTLGAVVCCPEWPVGDKLVVRVYDVDVVYTPVIWSKEDDARCQTEVQKIDFVSKLLTNALALHASRLVEHIGPYRAVLSREHSFARTETKEMSDYCGYSMDIYSGISVLDPARSYTKESV